MESVHETIGKNFTCDICGNKFLRKEYLAKHVKTHEFNYDVLPPGDEGISSTSLLWNIVLSREYNFGMNGGKESRMGGGGGWIEKGGDDLVGGWDLKDGPRIYLS